MPVMPAAVEGSSHRADVLAARRRRDAQLAKLGDELTRRRSVRGRVHRLRKKYLWIAVVGFTASLKRATDVVGAVVGMVLLAPVFVITAIAIKVHDGGNVLFWQTRVGRWGREFAFPKFRSMHLDAEARKAALLALNQHADGVTFKMKDDPRITPVGKFIRRASIDELPQLWCVLTGEMSLVGPRPPVPSEVARYTLADRRRLDSKPGLTCLWQVSGRGDVPFPQQVRLDIEYIESQSLWLDIRLLLRTVPAVLFARGAY